MTKNSKKVLLVGEDDNRAKEVTSIAKRENIEVTSLITLEEAVEKLFTKGEKFDAIIMAPAFPENEEKRAVGNEAKKLLEMMVERNCHIPTLLHGFMLEQLNYDFVVGCAKAWELLKLQDFLKNLN